LFKGLISWQNDLVQWNKLSLLLFTHL